MIDKKSRRDKRGLAIRVGAIFLVLALLLGMGSPRFRPSPARRGPIPRINLKWKSKCWRMNRRCMWFSA